MCVRVKNQLMPTCQLWIRKSEQDQLIVPKWPGLSHATATNLPDKRVLGFGFEASSSGLRVQVRLVATGINLPYRSLER